MDHICQASRALGVVLQDDSAARHLVVMAHIAHFQRDEVTSAQLAVDAEVEKGKFSYSICPSAAARDAPICPWV